MEPVGTINSAITKIEGNPTFIIKNKWLPLTFDIEKFEAFLLDTQKKDWQNREQSNISKQSLKRSEPNNMASSTKR
jgi:hypothetical protein